MNTPDQRWVGHDLVALRRQIATLNRTAAKLHKQGMYVLFNSSAEQHIRTGGCADLSKPDQVKFIARTSSGDNGQF